MVSYRSFKIYATHSTAKLSGSWAVWKLITFIDQWCMNWIYNLFIWLHCPSLTFWFIGLGIYLWSHKPAKEQSKTFGTIILYNLCSGLWLNFIKGSKWLALHRPCSLNFWKDFLVICSFCTSWHRLSAHFKYRYRWIFPVSRELCYSCEIVCYSVEFLKTDQV